MMNLDVGISILDGTFEAGLLIDEDGRVLHLNSAACELLGFHGPSRNVNCNDFLTFWNFEVADSQTEKDSLEWRDVCQIVLQHQIAVGPSQDWSITASPRSIAGNNTTFPGVSKITLLNDSDNPGRYFAFVFVRHTDTHELIQLSEHEGADSIQDEASSTTRGSTVRQRRKRFSQIRVLDRSDDPMIMIDEFGTILEFNEAAGNCVSWCTPEIVGKPLLHATFRGNVRTSKDGRCYDTT